jgi:hypothetical protein
VGEVGTESADDRTQMKAPRPKLQAPEKLQAPSTNIGGSKFLEVEVWSFSGSWSLELGALSHV